MKRIIIFILAILGMVVSIFAQNSWTSGTGVLYTNPNTTKVGIGISNPETLLHINNGALKIGNGTTAAERSTNVLRFGDEDYVQIGEWQADDVLSFRANGFTFGDGNVGIGISNPIYRLEVDGEMLLHANSTDSYFYWKGDHLIMGVPSGLSKNTKLDLKPGGVASTSLHSEFTMYSAFGTGSSVAKIKFNTGGNCWFLNTGNIGIGTSNPSYKLDVNGTIRANEVLVNTSSGADFVFDKEYNLRPLSEVHSYIQQNKHLPEIPSAKEMQENGVKMNELQIQLLQKVEELTLYIIQQELRIQELETQIAK